VPVCGLWFVVCGLWFVVCGLWFVVRAQTFELLGGQLSNRVVKDFFKFLNKICDCFNQSEKQNESEEKS
jgi:hypothetical protein